MINGGPNRVWGLEKIGEMFTWHLRVSQLSQYLNTIFSVIQLYTFITVNRELAYKWISAPKLIQLKLNFSKEKNLQNYDISHHEPV